MTDQVPLDNNVGQPSQQHQEEQQKQKKPARRRRLASRRQYTKSRRLASSYLRSKFVHYDDTELIFNCSRDFGGASCKKLDRTSTTTTTTTTSTTTTTRKRDSASRKSFCNGSNKDDHQDDSDDDDDGDLYCASDEDYLCQSESASGPPSANLELAGKSNQLAGLTQRLSQQQTGQHQRMSGHQLINNSWRPPLVAPGQQSSELESEPEFQLEPAGASPSHRVARQERASFSADRSMSIVSLRSQLLSNLNRHHVLGSTASYSQDAGINRVAPPLGASSGSMSGFRPDYGASSSLDSCCSRLNRGQPVTSLIAAQTPSFPARRQQSTTIATNQQHAKQPVRKLSNRALDTASQQAEKFVRSATLDLQHCNNQRNRQQQQSVLHSNNHQQQQSLQSQLRHQSFASSSSVIHHQAKNRLSLDNNSSAGRQGCDSNCILATTTTSNSSCCSSAKSSVSVSALDIDLLLSKQSHIRDSFRPLFDSFEAHLREKQAKQQAKQQQQAFLSPSGDCIDNVHFNDLYQGYVPESTSYTTQHVRSDPRLYKDDIDIKFSRALNSCKLPQIRYASKERLFERLFDLRFLSIDFLNTFLLTYRVFTKAEDIMDTLLRVYGADSFSVRAKRIQEERERQRGGGCQHTIAGPGSKQQQQPQQLQQQVQIATTSNTPVGPLEATRTTEEAVLATTNQQDRKPPRPSVPARQSISRDTSASALASGQHKPATDQSADSPIPRLLSAERQTSQQQQQQQQHLLLPKGGLGGNQKRRSTISALSPITGSNASSMLNMSLAVDNPNNNNNVAGSFSRHNLGLYGDVKNNNNNTNVDIDDDDDSLSANSSSFRADLSPPTTLRLRSASVARDRAPSIVHVLRASQHNLNRQSGSAAASNGANLLQLGGGQVRARSMLQLTTTPAGCEHWRLSYRKSGFEDTDNKTGDKKASQQSAAFLSPSTITGLKQRRASSSDAYQAPLGAVASRASSGRLSASSSSADTRKLDCSEFRLQLDLVASGAATGAGAAHASRHQSQPHVPPPTPDTEQAPSDTEVPKRPAVSRSSSTSSSSATSSSSSTTSSDGSSGSKRDPGQSRSESGSGLLASSCSDQNGHEDAEESPSWLERRRVSSLKRLSMKEIDLVAARDTDTSADEDEHELVACEMDTNENTDTDDDDDDDGQQEQAESSPSFAVSSASSGTASGGSSAAKIDQALRKMIRKRIQKVCPSELARRNNSKPKVLANRESTVVAVKLQQVSELEANSDKLDNNNLIRRRAERKESLKQASCDKLSSDCPPKTTKEGQQQANSVMDLDIENNDNKRNLGPAKQASLESVGGERNRLPPAQGLPALVMRNATSNGPQQSRSAQTSARNSCQLSGFGGPLTGAGQSSRMGVVVSGTNPRLAARRSSNSSAALAFAAATAASDNPLLVQPPPVAAVQSPIVGNSNKQLAQVHQQHHQQGQFSPSLMKDQIFFNNNSQRGGGGGDSRCSQRAASSSIVYETNSSVGNSRASSRLSSSADLDFNNSGCHPLAAKPAPNRCTSSATGGNQTPTTSASVSSIAGTGKTTTIGASGLATKRHSAASSQLPAQMQEQAQKHSVKTLATMRVLAVLRHWISKHSQDFLSDERLADVTLDFLKEIFADSRHYLQAEQYSALHVLVTLEKVLKSARHQVDLDLLLAPPTRPSPDSIETLSALEIAEGMTHLDHKIFQAIRSDEFLDQAWMKPDKALKAPHILLITKRFNDVSRLVASEIIRVPDLARRVAVIEKWTNVAHICRVLHNFNGVLQICAAFTNSAVFRLKKTWDKISKTTRTTIDQLQSLVSTDSKFRNMRDAINRCDPPSIPYVGMYLTDLSFIEEGSPDLSQEGLLNFSKLRMIAHVIREIQHLQKGNYKIELSHRVANYLLDGSRHLQDDEMYRCSLAIEPRSSNHKSGASSQLMSSTTTTTVQASSSQHSVYLPSSISMAMVDQQQQQGATGGSATPLVATGGLNQA